MHSRSNCCERAVNILETTKTVQIILFYFITCKIVKLLLDFLPVLVNIKLSNFINFISLKKPNDKDRTCIINR